MFSFCLGRSRIHQGRDLQFLQWWYILLQGKKKIYKEPLKMRSVLVTACYKFDVTKK